MRWTYFLLLIFFPLSIFASLNTDRDKIEQRIKPIGQVRLEEPAKQVVSANSTAQAIYEQHCIICHRDGVASAPKFRDDASWKTRLANRDIDALVASAIKGKNAMPPKGTCQECSNSDIKVTIEYMIPQK